MKTETWKQECDEWQAIKDEMIVQGLRPTAFDVSEEQRRRMAKRGVRPLTTEEILAAA